MRNLSKQKIQKRVWDFIHEFRDGVKKKYEKDIDFMIIYGSAVRKEFVPGKSDVDIVIQVFHQKDKETIEKGATKIFWEISDEYPELQFEKSLSSSKAKKRNALTKMLEKAEESSFLYVPVFVFVKGEINWEKGELYSNNPLIVLGKNLLVPQRSVFLRFKEEGEILMGRDIRKEIKIKLSLLDRLRMGVVPLILSKIAVLISFILSSKAQNYAVKALLYQIDALLTAIDSYKKLSREEKISENQKILLQEFSFQMGKIIKMRLDYKKGLLKPKDFDLFHEAVILKWSHKRLGYFETIGFCLRTWWFIVRTNVRAVLYLLFINPFSKKRSFVSHIQGKS